MIFIQNGEYAENHIREYDDFYHAFDIEEYGKGSETSLEELFLHTLKGSVKTFNKSILLLCFDENEESETLILETKLQTSETEIVKLYKVNVHDEGFPFDEEVMMLTVENDKGLIRRFRLQSEFYSLEEEIEEIETFEKAKDFIEKEQIKLNGFEYYLIGHF